MSLSEGWKNGVNDGIANRAWDDYDQTIQTEIASYNIRLAQTSGFLQIDWKIFKALLWVESGGPKNPAWKTRPLQIGNPGDPGLAALKKGEGASSVILSKELAQSLQTGDLNQPELNIKAGIAYALMRLAESDFKAIVDPLNPSVQSYTVKHGDSLSSIAKHMGSDLETVKKLNPGVHLLKGGQAIKYQKTKTQRVITRWKPVNSANLASRYNVGDANYAAKLDYVLALFPKLQRV